jgi:hypothetical protein
LQAAPQVRSLLELDRLNILGELSVYGAAVTITPDGTTTLSRGRWSHTL